MARPLLPAWTAVPTPVIGVLHLPPLPGAPRCELDLPTIAERTRRDADALVAGGVHGLLMENFGDTPFHAGRVPAAVVAYMTDLAGQIQRRHDVPLGINVLRNDARSALAIAHASGAAFIRVNILCGARVTDQGVIQGCAQGLLRDRARLGAAHVKILADVDVKHSTPLGAPRPIQDEVGDTLERGGADAVIVSGSGTGRPTDVEHVRRAKGAAGDAPVLVGSGVTPACVCAFLPHADGFIVGSAFKVDGLARNPVDPDRVRALLHTLA